MNIFSLNVSFSLYVAIKVVKGLITNIKIATSTKLGTIYSHSLLRSTIAESVINSNPMIIGSIKSLSFLVILAVLFSLLANTIPITSAVNSPASGNINSPSNIPPNTSIQIIISTYLFFISPLFFACM